MQRAQPVDKRPIGRGRLPSASPITESVSQEVKLLDTHHTKLAESAPSNTLLNMVWRACEVFLSATLLVCLAPLLLVVGVAIIVESNGPIIYISERLGVNGRAFKCYKLRSMYVNADALLDVYLSNNPEAHVEWQEFRKLKTHDPRATGVGRLLRRFSLDELPQLVNVLTGDMALVGPRPYLPAELPDMGTAAPTILLVKPGLTGLWQVSGRNDVAFSKRLTLDCTYVQHRSVRLDLKILWLTLHAVLLGRGAY